MAKNNNNKKKNKNKKQQLYVLIIYIYNFSKLKFLTSRIIKRSMFMKDKQWCKNKTRTKKKIKYKTSQNHRSWLKISLLNNNVRNLFLIITINYYLEKIFINRCLICPNIAFLRLHLMECECYKVSYSGIVIKR